MNCLSRLTTALMITRESEKGVIYFNEGEVVHAECGEAEGNGGLLQNHELGGRGVRLQHRECPPLQTIYQSWEHLLVEAMRRDDDKVKGLKGPSEGFRNRQMNIVITKKDLEKIDLCLNKMVSSSFAHSVLLMDRSGQLIAHQGDTPTIDISAFSALTAANFGATAEIARLLGEEEFTLLFHKGRVENVYFSAIGEHAIMVTLFDDETSLGLIRLRINQILDELSSFCRRSLRKRSR